MAKTGIVVGNKTFTKKNCEKLKVYLKKIDHDNTKTNRDVYRFNGNVTPTNQNDISRKHR